MRAGWHLIREDGAVTLARRLPARFDVSAEAELPPLRPARLAHMIRQDVWRALRGQRGFSPVVMVETTGGGVTVRAGGRLDGPGSRTLSDRVAAVLEDPQNRARWTRDARFKERADA